MNLQDPKVKAEIWSQLVAVAEQAAPLGLTMKEPVAYYFKVAHSVAAPLASRGAHYETLLLFFGMALGEVLSRPQVESHEIELQ